MANGSSKPIVTKHVADSNHLSHTNSAQLWDAQLPPIVTDSEEKIRRFLVYWATLMMFLVIVIFAITRDGSVLATSTILGVAITAVFSYYFKGKKQT